MYLYTRKPVPSLMFALMLLLLAALAPRAVAQVFGPQSALFDLRMARALEAAGGLWRSPMQNGQDFAPAVTYESGGYYATSVALADVNGDGIPDLVVANRCADEVCADAGAVSVLLGNGNGTFREAATYGSGGYQAYWVAVADMNGDGKPDLIVANYCETIGNSCPNGAVGVLLGNGDGTFQQTVAYGSGGYGASSVAVADVNGDGKPDIEVANYCFSSSACPSGGGGIAVLLGNGDGTFQTAVTYLSGDNQASSVAVADVNGDGKPDIIVTNQLFTVGLVGVLLGNGDGTFQTALAYKSGGLVALSVAVADINGDGIPDLVVANSGEGLAGQVSVGVLLGNGDGTFQAAVAYSSGGEYGDSVAVADVNGDGKPDVIITNSCNGGCGDSYGTVGVLLGNGDGTFQQALIFNSGAALPTSVAIADVNRDGKPDLAVANYCSDFAGCAGLAPLGVLLNNTTPVAVSASADPVQLNQSVSFTATVQTTNGIPPTGTVSFYNGAVLNATVPLNSSGQATYERAFYTPGTKSITASYSGDSNHPQNNSAVLLEGVSGDPTTTTVISHPNPTIFGQVVTFIAKVSSPFGQPTGTVTFKNGIADIGVATLSNGQGSLNFVFGDEGTKPITASYAGNANYASSTSFVLNEVVYGGIGSATTTIVTSNPNPSSVGQIVALVATVSSSQGSPTGTVTFKLNGNQIIGQAAVSNGQASINYAFGQAGTDFVAAIYSGDTTFTPSTGTLTQVVR